MKRVLLAASAVVALAACDHPAAPTLALSASSHASAAPRENVTKTQHWFEEDFVFFSRCSQELIHFRGRSHVVETRETDGSRTTYTFHYNDANNTGVGLTSGNEYRFSSRLKELGTFDSEPPFAFSMELQTNQTTVVKGEGRVTRILVRISATFDGTTFTEWQKTILDECPGVAE